MENVRKTETTEKEINPVNGMGVLIVNILLFLASVAGIIFAAIDLESGETNAWAVAVLVVSIVYICVPFVFFICGLKVLSPNEAYVFTLFGKYYGTLKGAGFYFVNPFVTAHNPASGAVLTSTGELGTESAAQIAHINKLWSKKISLKSMTLNNEKQKINDLHGNPIIIGIVVVWKVQNTAKAVFNVDNYKEYLSIQCDSALRSIVRMYPYDSQDDSRSLRGSSDEISLKLREEIQSKVEHAGLEISEARITHLSYANEIAAAMLQRQQATAIVDAKQMIVDGAVGMVEMALAKLSESNVVHLDEERKAAMVSNLLVVLCGNKDPQPIVNSGSLY